MFHKDGVEIQDPKESKSLHHTEVKFVMPTEEIKLPRLADEKEIKVSQKTTPTIDKLKNDIVKISVVYEYGMKIFLKLQ